MSADPLYSFFSRLFIPLVLYSLPLLAYPEILLSLLNAFLLILVFSFLLLHRQFSFLQLHFLSFIFQVDLSQIQLKALNFYRRLLMSVSKNSFFGLFFVLKLFRFSLEMKLDQKLNCCDLMDLMLSSYLKLSLGKFKFFQMDNQDYIVLRAIQESFYLKMIKLFNQAHPLPLIKLSLFFHQNLNPYSHLLDLTSLSISCFINYYLSSWCYSQKELYFSKSNQSY